MMGSPWISPNVRWKGLKGAIVVGYLQKGRVGWRRGRGGLLLPPGAASAQSYIVQGCLLDDSRCPGHIQPRQDIRWMQVMLEFHTNGKECLALKISTRALRVGRLAVEFGSSINVRLNTVRNRKPGPRVSRAIREENGVGRRTWCVEKQIFCQNSVEFLHRKFEGRKSYLIEAYQYFVGHVTSPPLAVFTPLLRPPQDR